MSNHKHITTGTSLWGPLVRTLVILAVGFVIVGLSCLANFQGITWLYNSDDDNMPLLDCPELGLGLQRDFFVDQGGFCELTVHNWKPEAKAYLEQWGYSGEHYECLVPYIDLSVKNIEHFPAFAAKNPIKCRTKFPCSKMKLCANENSEVFECPRGAEEVHHQPGFDPDKVTLYVSLSPQAGFYVKWDDYNEAVFSEFCDSGYVVSVGQMIAVRGLLVAIVFIAFIWMVIDFYLLRVLRTKQRPSMDLALIESQFNADHNIVPAHDPRDTGMMSMTVRSVSRDEHEPPREFKVSICEDPSKVFHSVNWLTKVWDFHSKKNRIVPPSHWVAYAACLAFVLLFGFLVSWAYLALSPSDLVNSYSVSDVLFSSYGSVWTASSTWIILPFLFLDELYDILLFISISPIAKWGKPSVFKETICEDDMLSEDSFVDDKIQDVVSQRLIPEGIVAVIVVDEYRIPEAERFVSNVNAAIDVFGADNVYILQFSKFDKPMDDTVLLCDGLQYVYVPERDKLAALYWFSKYYIPVVQLHGGAGEEISHLLIVDQSIALCPDLSIPAEFVHSLEETDEGTQRTGCVCFASNGLNTISSRFDIATSIFLSDRSSLGDSEINSSNVVLWERDSLELAAFNLVPTTAGLGGDFNGLGTELLRYSKKCDSRRVKFVPDTLSTWKASTLGDTLIVEARKRRLFFEDCVSIISPTSILNLSRLAAKPVVFGRILNAVFDLIRLPVLFSSALRDPVGLGAMFLLIIVFTYSKVGILVYGLIRFKTDRPGIFSVISYPFIHCFWTLLIIRPAAVITAFVWALHDSPGPGIAEREDFNETIPPMLPYPQAPWFTVWKEEKELPLSEWDAKMYS